MRALLLALIALLPLSAQVRRYYIVGAMEGLVVALAESPESQPSQYVRLPVPEPPTLVAQRRAQDELNKLCQTPWVVACTHIPEQSGGRSDLWILEGPNQWKPATRITLGGCLICAGLVASPVGMGGALEDVYGQAFVDAAVNRRGYYADLGPDGGRSAGIIGIPRMVQYFELEQTLAKQKQQRQTRRPLPTGEKRITIEDDPKQMTEEQHAEWIQRKATEAGVEYDPKTMTVRKLPD